MIETRRRFEQRRTAYLKNAAETMQRLNDAVATFNDCGWGFRIDSLKRLRNKSVEGWVTDSLRKRLNRVCNGIGLTDKQLRLATKYRRIDERLKKPAEIIRDALTEYGKMIEYETSRQAFVLNSEMLERAALSYADDV